MTSAREMTDEELIGAWRVFTDGVARTQASIARDMESLDLPVASFDALHRLLEAKEHRLPMSMLARELQMTSGGFTKVADRMARAGLIDRRGTAGDRRVVHATLTEKGEQLAVQAVDKYKASLRRNLLGVLPTPAFTRLVELGGALRKAHASAAPSDAPEQVAESRDPVMPDRRGERRAGGPEDRRAGPRPGDAGFVERRAPRPGADPRQAAGLPPGTRPGMIPPGYIPGRGPGQPPTRPGSLRPGTVPPGYRPGQVPPGYRPAAAPAARPPQPPPSGAAPPPRPAPPTDS